MKMFVPKAQRMLDLDGLRTSGFATQTIQLVKTDLSEADMLDPAIVNDAANEADFDGYARKTGQNYSDPAVTDSEEVEMLSGNQVFIATGGTTPNTIFGYVVENGLRNNVWYAEKFDTPIGIGANGDAVAFVIRISQEQNSAETILVS